jgi:hypothetical protein
MAWTKDRVDRTLADIIRRAQRDAAFRKLCLTDAAAAVKAVADEPLPAGFTLRFVDNDRADLVVVLPDFIEPGSSRELSDDELSAVSGGVGGSSFKPRTPGSCFAAGTPVLLADGGWRPIESIAPGTAVQAFDETHGRVMSAHVSERLVHDPEPLFRAVIEGIERPLLVTANHPFYVADAWRRIGELALRSELFHFDASRGEMSTRRLLAFQSTGAREPVFNFEVAEAHTYFVDGLLVHNGGIDRLK